MWCSDDSDSDSCGDSSDGEECTEQEVAPGETQVAHEDIFDPSIRTTVVPIRIKAPSYRGEQRELVHSVEPPRTGMSPHGYTMKTWLYNIKKAVAAENKSHVAHCLVTYFMWFQAAELLGDNGVVRVVPVREPTLWRELQEKTCAGGIFNNRWSAFLHQQLYLALFQVFFEVIGVCGPLLVRRLQELWREYELSLFCQPIRSLSKLLTMGQALVDSQKNGAVYFASFVFSDTALLRRKREQLLSNPQVVRCFVKGETAERVLSVLAGFKPVYFRQRHRKNLYRECYTSQEDNFLELGNITHLVQSLPVSDKKATKLIAKQREVAAPDVPSRFKPKYLQSLVDLERLYTSVACQPNNYACRKLGRQVMESVLVCTHLLSCLASANIDVWNTCSYQEDEVNHAFAERLWNSALQSSLFMVYGVTSDKNSNLTKLRNFQLGSSEPVARPSRAKKRKVSVNEQEEIRASGGPSTVAISHEHAYPASKCHDGYFHLADFVAHCNYTADVLPELEALYFTSMNLGYLLRQYSKQSTLPPKTVTDNVLIDLSKLTSYSSRAHVGVCQKYFSAPVLPGPALLPGMEQVWTGDDLDSATVLFEHLCGFRENDLTQHRPRTWLLGPYAIDSHVQVGSDFEWLRQLRSDLGFDVGQWHLRQLVLQDFPLAANATEHVGRPYLFYTETLPAVCTTQTRADGSKLMTATKPLPKYIEDIRKTQTLGARVRESLVQLAVLIEAFGTEKDWQFTFVTQEVLLQPSGAIFVGAARVSPSLGIKTTPNTERMPAAYQRLLPLFQGDDINLLEGLCAQAGTALLRCVSKHKEEQFRAVRELLAKDLELELEV